MSRTRQNVKEFRVDNSFAMHCIMAFKAALYNTIYNHQKGNKKIDVAVTLDTHLLHFIPLKHQGCVGFHQYILFCTVIAKSIQGGKTIRVTGRHPEIRYIYKCIGLKKIACFFFFWQWEYTTNKSKGGHYFFFPLSPPVSSHFCPELSSRGHAKV